MSLIKKAVGRVKKKPAWFAAYLLTWFTIPHILLSRKRPVSTLAWVWAVIAVPFAGPLAYFAIGADRMQRKRLKKAARLGLLYRSHQETSAAKESHLTERDQELLKVVSEVNQLPPSSAHSAQLLVDAREFYPELIRCIDEAHLHIHVEFFIFRSDSAGENLLDALVRAALRGVEVRLLLDQIGCLGLSKSFFRPLVEAGGKFSWFYSLPLWKHSRFMNLRNHRKLQIIDGTIAFVGGMNVGAEHLLGLPKLGPWRDAQVKVEGAVVQQLQHTFAEDWFFATDQRFSGLRYYPKVDYSETFPVQVIAGGPDLPREPIVKSMLALFSHAKKRVWISTGYFVPNELLLASLQLCAARGVDVRLIISSRSDHPYLLEIGRSYYGDLLDWKIRVFEYQEGINHKKAMLVDDHWLMIGSANSDNRSMRLNFELNLLLHAPGEAARLEEVMLREFEWSTEIKSADVRAKTFPRRLLEAALRPLAPLL